MRVFWTIRGPCGDWLPWTTSYTRKGALTEWRRVVGASKSWRVAYRDGFRCVRTKISVAG